MLNAFVSRFFVFQILSRSILVDGVYMIEILSLNRSDKEYESHASSINTPVMYVIVFYIRSTLLKTSNKSIRNDGELWRN